MARHSKSLATLSLVSFHTCVNRTHSCSQCLPVQEQLILTNNLTLCNKSLLDHIKVAYVELVIWNSKLVPRYAVTATYGNQECRIQKKFSALWKKRGKPMSTFLAQYRVRYAICIASKCKRCHNNPYDACLWKRAKRNKVCTREICCEH